MIDPKALSDAREDSGLTVAELAYALECPTDHVCRLERKPTKIDTVMLRRICEVLCCSADDLLGL